jgi:hypothetical protein
MRQLVRDACIDSQVNKKYNYFCIVVIGEAGVVAEFRGEKRHLDHKGDEGKDSLENLRVAEMRGILEIIKCH